MLNHYDVLGVEPTADLESIRRAWRVKVQLLHPDRHQGASDDVLAEAIRETHRVNGAWETLKDPDRRRKYDLRIATGRDPGATNGNGKNGNGHANGNGRGNGNGDANGDANGSDKWSPPPRPDGDFARNVRVTCPMCKTTQDVPRSAGRFECSKCKTAWQFAKCEKCHKIAQVRERRTNWRCDSCGRQQNSSWGGGAGEIACVVCSTRIATPAGAQRVSCTTCALEHVRCRCGHFTSYLGLSPRTWRCLKCKRMNGRSPKSSFDFAMFSIVLLAVCFVAIGVVLLAGMAQ